MPEIAYVLGPLDGKAGQCDQRGPSKVIIISEETWANLCDAQKKSVVWHELGHCVLGRSHADQATISYMIPDMVPCGFYETNDAELELEMFNP